jgi:hypothetical protein
VTATDGDGFGTDIDDVPTTELGRMVVVHVLDPGITVGRILAAFRAVSKIRTGCGGVFFTSVV